jgi:hypothetical protein
MNTSTIEPIENFFIDSSFCNTKIEKIIHKNDLCGLLIMKDENDILYEYLEKVIPFYKKIYVLDGSHSNEGKNICSKFSEIVFYAKDSEFTNDTSTDSIRGYLYEKIKLDCEKNVWVGVLHPDEFPSNDIFDLIEYVVINHPTSESILVENVQYFPHISQKESWNFKEGDKIEPLLKWGMLPGHKELRYFKLNKDTKYEIKHGWVVPFRKNYNIVNIVHEHFHHKHFSIRSKEQFKLRCKTRIETNWSDWYLNIKENNDIFFESLTLPGINDASKTVPKPFLMS